MPATLRMALDLTSGPQVYPARLHGAGCAITGSHGDGHAGPPFAAGPLFDDEHGRTWWRLGWLAEREPPHVPAEVVFGDVRCPVSSATVEQVGFAELAAGLAAGHAHLSVVSPMFFSRNGRDHPLPDPALIMRSAATRWNLHAPPALAVPEDLLRELGKLVYLADFDGRTVRAPVSATMTQTGFVGDVHLALVRAADRAARVTFAALVRFVALAGAGAQTTHGFGAVEVVELTR